MTTVVIDANIGLALALPLPYSDQVFELMGRWNAARVRFAVPALWGFEVVSGLRKAVVAGMLTSEEASAAIQELWALDIQEIETTLEMHLRALAWAERLGQRVAYDTQYLVVAEGLNAPFWTADRSLADAAQGVGASWVRSISQPE